MKKTVLVVLLIAVGCVVVACARNRQTHEMKASQTREHMTFVNTPISGSCKEFAQILMDKGYRYVGNMAGAYELRGNYMGKRDCRVVLRPIDNERAIGGDEVYMVGVSFENNYGGDNGAVFEHYVDLMDLLTAEFGKPNKREKCVCELDKEYDVMMEFESKEGFVKLGMVDGGVIDLLYVDKLNLALREDGNSMVVATMKHDNGVQHKRRLVYQS